MEKVTPEEENDPETIYSFEVLKGDFVVKVSVTRKMNRQLREEWLKEIMRIALSRLPVPKTTPNLATATPKR